MAIKRGSKVDMNSSSASMTDLMFLLLIFLMIATTLINNNALQVSLPKSTSPTQEKPATRISITADSHFFLDDQPVQVEAIDGLLKEKLTGQKEPIIFLFADKKAPWEDVVMMMNIANKNNYKLSAATTPE
ncbi:MAG: biopolymer transporter ExbD [Mucinivorans sp.]